MKTHENYLEYTVYPVMGGPVPRDPELSASNYVNYIFLFINRTGLTYVLAKVFVKTPIFQKILRVFNGQLPKVDCSTTEARCQQDNDQRNKIHHCGLPQLSINTSNDHKLFKKKKQPRAHG